MILKAAKPASLKDAETLHARGWTYMAGGTFINWTPSGMNPERVVLLEGLLPESIEKRGSEVHIGAMTPLQALADGSGGPAALHSPARMIPSRNIRNMATVGGNIAANQPDSALIPVLLALEARVVTASGEELALTDYLSEGQGTLISGVRIPPVAGRCVVDRAARSSAAYPAALTAVRVSEGTCIIALGCVADHCIRLQAVEQAVESGTLSTEEAVFQAVYEAIDPPASLRESAAYKRYIAATLVAKTVLSCREKD